MHRHLILPLCLIFSLACAAQDADTRIGQCMNSGDWFALQRELRSTPRDSISPLLREMGEAMTHHYFNRPDSACMAIGALMNNHAQELGSSILGMATLLGIDLARTGQYAQAASLMEDLLGQLTEQGADSTQTGAYRIMARQYRSYANGGDICKPLHKGGEYRIPMVIDEKLGQRSLNMHGHINGHASLLLFDTGAGANVISSRQAEEYGLRMLDATIPAAGIGGRQEGRCALADTLRIGDMAWTSVPFLVLDMSSGHEKADSILKNLQPVIGLPMMLSMQEVQMDFDTNEFIIPSSPTPNPLCAGNLIRTDGENLRLSATDGTGNGLRFHFDTGAYVTSLLPHWYEQHKAEVESAGRPDSLRLGGAGGVSVTRSYVMPRIDFRIGSNAMTLDSVHVSTGIDLHTGLPREDTSRAEGLSGAIGVSLIEKFSRVILNLKDMYLEAIP